MASPDFEGTPLRRSARSTKGMLPASFRNPELDSRSSVSEQSSRSSVSNSARRRRAELDAAVRLAKIEQQKARTRAKVSRIRVGRKGR